MTGHAITAPTSSPALRPSRTPNEQTSPSTRYSKRSAANCHPNADGPLTELWNGTGWRTRRSPSDSNEWFLGVSCLTATDCEVDGLINVPGNLLNVGVVQEWNGSSWTRQTRLGISSALDSISSPSVNHCEAIGQNWTEKKTNPGTLALGWDGTTWKVQHDPTLS
jgi:hypothetical protein